MAYNTAKLSEALKNYVDANKMQLLVDSVATSDDTSMMSLMPDAKTDSPIVILSLDAEIVDGMACGFDGNDTSISDRIVKVTPVKAQYEWCEKDLIRTALASEYSKDNMAFEQKLTQMIVEKNSRKLNSLIWTGKKTGGSDLMDGLMTIIAGETSITPITNSRTNYMDRIKDIYLAIKPEYVATTEVYCSPVVFRNLIMELNDAKVINYNLNVTDAKSFIYPGTNLKINMIEALGNSTEIIATEPTNMVLATSFEDDSIRVWYSADNETFRATWFVIAGVQIAFPDRVVYDKN